MSKFGADGDSRSGRASPRRRAASRPAKVRAVDPARRAAYDVLRAVDAREAYANLALPSTLRRYGLAGRDAGFATELTYGTLRRLGTWDAVLAACVDRPSEAVDPSLRDVLRLGTHQLLAMRVAAHAAVSATVDLARAVAGDGAARFANAVLRRVATRDLDGWLAEITEGLDDIERLAVVHAHPRWIVASYADALGGELDEVAAALAADNEAPPVTLAVRPGRATVDELVEAGAVPGRWSPYAATLRAGDPSKLPAVAEGRAGVQDEGSQLVTLALANAPLAGNDDRWLDLCAGPGGKAALLAGLAAPRGSTLLAVERQMHRARLVARALSGTAGRWAVVAGDATVPAWRAARFDRVLLDVPCTGLGALRRRPEARWRRSPADVSALRPVQAALLRTALDAARPGGLVAYVTCSPHPAETTVIVNDVLSERGDAEYLDARPLLAGVPDLGGGPHIQLWPHRHGTDAMFLALLRKM
jgi:16S rRNA (cytosine967-C5)-methyltransferase